MIAANITLDRGMLEAGSVEATAIARQAAADGTWNAHCVAPASLTQLYAEANKT